MRERGLDERQPFLAVTTGQFTQFDKSTGEIVLDRRVTQIVPIKLTLAEIPKVIDLRLPEVQDWFLDTFYDLETRYGRSPSRSVRVYAVRQLTSFRDLIPTLLQPERGGSTFHQAIGAWLRTSGVHAFIYPSARRNVRVSANGRDVMSFDGWNLVLYAGSGPADFGQAFGQQATWLREEHIGAQVVWNEHGKVREWTVSGVEASQRRQWQYELAVLAGEYRPRVPDGVIEPLSHRARRDEFFGNQK